jgi:hypothetical protein
MIRKKLKLLPMPYQRTLVRQLTNKLGDMPDPFG